MHNFKLQEHVMSIIKSNKPRDALPLLNTLSQKFLPDLYVDTTIIKDTNVILVAAISRIYNLFSISGTIPFCIIESLNKEDKTLRAVANYFFEHLEDDSNETISVIINNIVEDYEKIESASECSKHVSNASVDCFKQGDNALVDCSKHSSNALVDRSKHVSNALVDQSKQSSNASVDRSKHVSNASVDRSKQSSNALVDCSKQSDNASENGSNHDTLEKTSLNNLDETNMSTSTIKQADNKDFITLTNIDEVDATELKNFDYALAKLFKPEFDQFKINAVRRKVTLLEILLKKNKTRDLKIMEDLFYIEYEILKNDKTKNNSQKLSKLLKLYFSSLKNPVKINKYYLQCLRNNFSALKYVNLVIKKCDEYKIKFKFYKFLKICKDHKNLQFIDATKIPFKYFVKVICKFESTKKYENLIKAAIRNENNIKKLICALKKIEELENKNKTAIRVIAYLKAKIEGKYTKKVK